jgi:hypothetical protein
MPKINLKLPSTHSAKETFEKVKDLFENDSDLKKMDSSYVCQFQDADYSGTAKGTKFSAKMKIDESGSASEVAVDIEIPFMLSPFKGVIKDTLEKKLGKTLRA